MPGVERATDFSEPARFLTGEFQKIHPPLAGVLHKELLSNRYSLREATWRSGYAADCKSAYSGSIPDVASNNFHNIINALRQSWVT